MLVKVTAEDRSEGVGAGHARDLWYCGNTVIAGMARSYCMMDNISITQVDLPGKCDLGGQSAPPSLPADRLYADSRLLI